MSDVGGTSMTTNSNVTTVVDGLNGKNSLVVLLTIVIVGFGFLIYNFTNKAFEFIEQQTQTILTQLVKIDDSVNRLSQNIAELNIKIRDK